MSSKILLRQIKVSIMSASVHVHMLGFVRREKVQVPSVLRCPPGNWAGPAGSNLDSHEGDDIT
jgi:hypothetical protein